MNCKDPGVKMGQNIPLFCEEIRGVAGGGGAIGAKPPPGPVKSIDFRGVSCPNGC